MAAFHSCPPLNGICGAVWCTIVNVDIQKWYPSQGPSQYLTIPNQPKLETISGKATAAKAAHEAHDTNTYSAGTEGMVLIVRKDMAAPLFGAPQNHPN